MIQYQQSQTFDQHSDGIRFPRGSLSLPKSIGNSRSFALEFLLRLSEENTDMADLDEIKIAK